MGQAIDLEQLPFLKSLCWQGEKPSIAGLSESEILQLYERNWRYRLADLSEIERDYIRQIAQRHQSWLANDI